MIVVADTSPVNYFVLIQEADLLFRYLAKCSFPPAVWEKLNDPDAPAPVRAWLAQVPPWLHVQPLLIGPECR